MYPLQFLHKRSLYVAQSDKYRPLISLFFLNFAPMAPSRFTSISSRCLDLNLDVLCVSNVLVRRGESNTNSPPYKHIIVSQLHVGTLGSRVTCLIESEFCTRAYIYLTSFVVKGDAHENLPAFCMYKFCVARMQVYVQGMHVLCPAMTRFAWNHCTRILLGHAWLMQLRRADVIFIHVTLAHVYAIVCILF